MEEKVNFGFEKVDAKEKTNRVKEVFSSVSSKYDIMNDVMSFGVHRLWKKHFVNQLDPDQILLDVASGTGDIVKLYYNKCKNPNITLCDINPDMLEVGRAKLLDSNIFKGLQFICANAEELPFDDQQFDYYTIAFGIRNVTNVNKALKEAYRVLKPGGRFLCMEFAKVSNPIIEKFYDCFSMNLIPKMGKIIAGDEASYQYLVESIKVFPGQKDFIEMIEQAGFKLCKYENLTFGVAAIYSGYRV